MINLEAQKDYYPGYQIPTRGIFYGARMLSAQLGTEFSGSEYDKLKKVYSIWLCMGVPSFIGNAAAQYHMVKSDLSPGFPDVKQAYDKLTVVVIGLKEDDGYPHPLFGMLNTLLSPGLPAREKKELLQGRYSMKMDYGMEKTGLPGFFPALSGRRKQSRVCGPFRGRSPKLFPASNRTMSTVPA